MNLTKQDRETIGRLARRLDLNFREAVRQAIRNEYVRVEQQAVVDKIMQS